VVSGVFDNTTTAAELDQIVVDYCVTQDSSNQTCEQRVTSSFNALVTKCYQAGILNTSQIESMRYLLAASTIACLHDDVNTTHFCVHDFKVLTSMGPTPDEAALVAGCTACSKKVIDALFIFAPKETLFIGAYLDTICIQQNNKFCFITFMEATNLNVNGVTTEGLNAWCDPCVGAYLYRYVALVEFFTNASLAQDRQIAGFLALTRVVCVKDFKGQYCFPQLTSDATQTALQTLGADCLPGFNSSCTQKCHDQLQSVKNTLGCCFGTWFNLISWQAAFDPTNYSLPYPPDQIRGFITNFCQSTIPYGCAQQEIKLALTISGVNLAWIWANEQLVKDSFIAFLIYRLAVDSSAVTDLQVVQALTTVQSAANGYQLQDATSFSVTGTITPADDVQAGLVQTLGQNTATDSDAVNNPWTSSWVLGSRANPDTAPFVSASTATSVSTSGANVVSPTFSLAVILLSIVALLFG